MTDHPALEPAAIVRIRAGEPSSAATSTAAFADLICADHELLRAEFDAIIAANFPGAAERGQRLVPANTATTATGRVPPRRWPAPSARHPGRGRPTETQNLRARQRGPPSSQGPPVRDTRKPEARKSNAVRRTGGG
jgi:hypothetical protein